MYKAHSGVPLPKPIMPKTPRRKYPFETMEVGDMFFVPDQPKNTLVTWCSTVGTKLGRKFTTRVTHVIPDKQGNPQVVEPDTDGAVQGIGVWRTE